MTVHLTQDAITAAALHLYLVAVLLRPERF